MTFGGIGPKLACICMPYIVLSLVVMNRFPEFLNLGYLDNSFLKITGLIWLATGTAFWIASVIVFLTDFKKGKLITRGPFGLCRNPIYASMIIFVVPSLAVIFHSGLIFSVAFVLYIGFKISIHGETILLRRTFGNEYVKYEESVNDIFPFPRFLFHKNRNSKKPLTPKFNDWN